MIVKLILLPLFAYMLGSIPWGIILTKFVVNTDVRHYGSGNIGATNVRRVAGIGFAMLTLAGDLLKGSVPLILAIIILNGASDLWVDIYKSLIALCAFGGHLFPLFLKFKNGGKGVATAGGCFLVLAPGACIIAILIFILICWLSLRVSAASLAAFFSLPFAVWITCDNNIFIVCAIIMSIFIFIRHKDNIGRLLTGTESVIER
ncbi:Glycerol-3-phosphate acyltransferase [Candidatus Magnetomoraceae bacterium gMMP-15]